MATIRFLMIDDDGWEEEVFLPAEWEICDSCQGEGTTTRHIEPDGGGFTSSEWSEACYDDPDFPEDYFRGVYDQPCPECNGSGKILVVDEKALDEKTLERYENQRRFEAQIRAEEAYQRRYGF